MSPSFSNSGPNAEPSDSFESEFERANAQLYRHTSRAEKAFRRLLDTTDVGDLSQRARILERLCIVTRILGRYDEATKLGDEALPLFETLGDDVGMGRTCVALGNIYWSTGNLLKALAYYETALEIRRKVDDPQSLAGALGSVANILSELGRLDEAREHYEEALLLSENLKDQRFAARTHNNLGECLMLLNQPAAALRHCERALQMARAMGDYTDEPNVLINLGRIRTLLREWQTALDLLDEAAATAVIGEDRRAEAEAMMYRGELTEQRGQEDPSYLGQAELFREEALKLAEAIGALPLCEQLHTQSAEAAERANNHVKASRHWAAVNALRNRSAAQD